MYDTLTTSARLSWLIHTDSKKKERIQEYKKKTVRHKPTWATYAPHLVFHKTLSSQT